MSKSDPDDLRLSPWSQASFQQLLQVRLSRRQVLQGAIAGALGMTAPGTVLASPENAGTEGRFRFPEIDHGVSRNHVVAEGYEANVLLRWGDPVTADAPAFEVGNQSVAAQGRQFGYNNDFVGFVPLDGEAGPSGHGLLCVNHEYTNPHLMFPDPAEDPASDAFRTQIRIQMAAHGGSVVEVRRDAAGRWQLVGNSCYGRRITALDTIMEMGGPAAGHPRLRTSTDPTGRRVVGTVCNCAGGVTPWGTYLMAEENFNAYFERRSGDPELDGHPEERNYRRYGVPGSRASWGLVEERWNVHREPNEANRFGWVVEVDVRNPDSVPVKRTALGRFKHEGAETLLNGDGRAVVYMGDDQVFEYLYRYVSRGRFDAANPEANRRLLDDGLLSVARLEADGTLRWLPLRFGTGPLTPDNGFHSQADVLIETRRAADLLGATPMDRPEDVSPDPLSNRVYVMLTKNKNREPDQVDFVSRRPVNAWGQILELIPPGDDHGTEVFGWEILVQCGDPRSETTHATWNPATSANGWFCCPDNSTVDSSGRLWVATDQGGSWHRVSGTADGLWGLETRGPLRGTGRMFFRAPVGAEVCGPCFTPDGTTLFLAVQHPAVSGAKYFQGFGRDSTFADPVTRWPDFDPTMPPRPAVLAITREDGGVIGA